MLSRPWIQGEAAFMPKGLRSRLPHRLKTTDQERKNRSDKTYEPPVRTTCVRVVCNDLTRGLVTKKTLAARH